MANSSIRPERGKHNITYRNGTFHLKKRTAAEAGFPARIAILRNRQTGEVLLFPAAADEPNSYKLMTAGQTAWGNSFTSFRLARVIGLPPKGQTVYLFATWDEERGGLRFRYQPKHESGNVS